MFLNCSLKIIHSWFLFRLLTFAGELGHLAIICNTDCNYLWAYNYPFFGETEFSVLLSALQVSVPKTKHKVTCLNNINSGEEQSSCVYGWPSWSLQGRCQVPTLSSRPYLAHNAALDCAHQHGHSFIPCTHLLLNNLFGSYSCTPLWHHFCYSCTMLSNFSVIVFLNLILNSWKEVANSYSYLAQSIY